MHYYFDAYKNCLNSDQNYGRASRKEFWLFTLFHYIIIFLLGFIDAFFELYPEESYIEFGYCTIIYFFISIVPAISIQVRRLHDIDRSGFDVLMAAVPILSIYLFYLNLKEGSLLDNEYGVAPEVRNYYLAKAKSKDNDPEQSKQDIAVSNASADVVPEIKFCRKCGEKLIENSSFCRMCGTEVISNTIK